MLPKELLKTLADLSDSPDHPEARQIAIEEIAKALLMRYAAAFEELAK